MKKTLESFTISSLLVAVGEDKHYAVERGMKTVVIGGGVIFIGALWGEGRRDRAISVAPFLF